MPAALSSVVQVSINRYEDVCRTEEYLFKKSVGVVTS